jgi:3-hydroxybutyryl-CoA dehydrogenase
MIKKVGVVGLGQMGSGIAQVAAQAGYNILATDAAEEYIAKGIRNITKQLDKAIEKGKLDAAGKEKVLGNIKTTTEMNDFADCDIVIEAVIENMAAKKEIFGELDKICKPETIFASNTSSLPIGDLSAVTKRRDKFLGLHFFNPVPVMKLVEVVRTLDTSEETFNTAFGFAQSVGKTPVKAKDTPGFIVNVLLVPYLLDAIRQYENGLASREDIDNGMMLGCGHPMGPLTLTDFIGLDTILYIADIFFEEFKDHHYAAPPLLRRMVNAGYLGKKSGRGFYEYNK